MDGARERRTSHGKTMKATNDTINNIAAAAASRFILRTYTLHGRTINVYHTPRPTATRRWSHIARVQRVDGVYRVHALIDGAYLGEVALGEDGLWHTRGIKGQPRLTDAIWWMVRRHHDGLTQSQSAVITREHARAALAKEIAVANAAPAWGLTPARARAYYDDPMEATY